MVIKKIQDWQILHIIRKNKKITIKDLIKEYNTDEKTMKEVLDRLIEKKKIYKCDDYYIR